MPDIEIKRGYEVLPDNNVRFGIRVINNSDYAISDVEVILDFTESLFQLEGDKIQNLGNIPPSVPRTAKFILKPLGCIHKENISATIIFKDHQWIKHTLEMRPKEVHCVCPFLKEKSIKRADFLAMSRSGFMEERGLNFEGITVDRLVDFITHTCKNRLYKVDEFSIDNGKILYLAGDAVGEKAYYLLTAVVKEYEGLTQVLLRVNSDKIHGLNGFLNETLDNLRHLVVSTSAREIGIIKKEHVINIIDSVVQRSNISMDGGAPEIKIRDSMVQRVEVKGDEERKRKEEEIQGKIEAKRRENELQREREEEKRQIRLSEETPRMQREQKDEGLKDETEEEEIQRLVKEGLQIETEEEKVKRLVQEELKNVMDKENKTLRYWDMTTEEWEEIRNKALSGLNPIVVYPASIIMCGIVFYLISLFLSMMGLSDLNFIFLNPFVIIGVGLFGAYMSISQTKKIWESPESYYKITQGKKPRQKLR